MTRTQSLFFLTSALALLLFGSVVSFGDAHAVVPTTSKCHFYANYGSKKGAVQAQAWIDERLAEGRTHILSGGNGTLCAW